MTKGDIERYRVEAAIAAMHGIRSDHETIMMLVRRNDLDGEVIDLVARLAVQQAEALMKELGLDRE